MKAAMGFCPLHVANNILARAFEEKTFITPMKLQRILYIVASEYAKSTGSPLLYEGFRAWDYGPVIPTVYYHFSAFGAAPIRKFAKDAAGNASRIDEKNHTDLKKALDRVWNAAKHVSPVDLSKVTQAANPAWTAAYHALSSALEHKLIVADTGYFGCLGLKPIAP